ncbi:unnamed protein product [Sphagnum troendelagicum]|uniref:Protein kinase domain-containing protein n=1 Tax=Sphagnum troendelagicum TaxID=128251 RepID=A0ABP0U4Z5_9BRYO
MAGITAHLLATVVFFSVLASGKIDRVAAYRPRFFAFQNRHFPHPVVVAAITKDSSWLHGNPPPLQATSNTEKNIFVIPTSPNNKLSLFSSWKSLSLSERPLAVEVAQRPKDSASQQMNSASNGMIVQGMMVHKLSNRWFLMLLLVPAALLFLAVLVCLYRACRMGKGYKSSSRMLVWTNQATLQPHLDMELSRELSSLKLNGSWLGSKRTIAEGGLPVSACRVAYTLLQNATNNFSSSNLLGEGSFSHVYKANLDYGIFAAVKRLEKNGKHGENAFQAEVDLMSKIRHPNLVALLGFSSDGPEHLLVYELMHNGSLHDQLHGPSHGSGLSWHLRLKIALEAARGLEHLHDHCKPAVIHRDFKASNILLDARFNAKVSDFGLAIANPEGNPPKNSVQVQGTFGYVAPEYLMNGSLTEKSDVYGFGVVLLELLTGRLPVDSAMTLGSQSLVTCAMPVLSDRAKILEIMDPCLHDTVNLKHLYQVGAVVKLCLQSEPSYRPLITDVIQSLVPLVPIELGGAWRDTKAPQTSSKTFKPPVSALLNMDVDSTK